MSETLTGRTTREVTFGYTDPRSKVVTSITRKPAGTEVYVTRMRADGTWDIRIPGTLYTQNVRPASVESF
jgi:hypothetical protein